MEDVIARIRRTSKLGRLGEYLAAEALVLNGYSNVRNLNDEVHNHPFADLLAEKDGVRFFIGVKTRNEERDLGGLNESYNCVLVPDVVNRRLKHDGMTAEGITALALRQVDVLAARFDAVPAWVAVPVRTNQGSYAAYFGLLRDLGNRRSVPMTLDARRRHKCLVDWTRDPRITPDLCNQVSRQLT